MRLVATPLCNSLNLYGIRDDAGRLVAAGDYETCARLLLLLHRPAEEAEADEFAPERLRQSFERWLSM